MNYAARNLIVLERIKIVAIGNYEIHFEIQDFDVEEKSNHLDEPKSVGVAIKKLTGDYCCTCRHGSWWRWGRSGNKGVCYHAQAAYGLLRRLLSHPSFLSSYAGVDPALHYQVLRFLHREYRTWGEHLARN